MARPGERGYGKKPDDNRDGRCQNTLACHDSCRHTRKCVWMRKGEKTVYIYTVQYIFIFILFFSLFLGSRLRLTGMIVSAHHNLYKLRIIDGV